MRVERVDDELEQLTDFGLKFTFRHIFYYRQKQTRKGNSGQVLLRVDPYRSFGSAVALTIAQKSRVAGNPEETFKTTNRALFSDALLGPFPLTE